MQVTDLSHYLEQYLDCDVEGGIDVALAEYLKTAVEFVSQGSSTEEQGRRLEALIAELCVVLPLHLSRKHIDLVDHGSLIAVRRAFEKVSVGGEGGLGAQVAERFRSLSRVSRKPIVWTLPDPITLGGYDPRFTEESETYKSLLEEVARNLQQPLDEPELAKRYNTAKADIYRDFHDQSRRYDLLIVDFAWLPELAYQGHVIPLESFEPRVEKIIRELLQPQFPNKNQAQSLSAWVRIASELSKAGNEMHYGIPLVVNAHGRLIPTERRRPQPDRIEEIKSGRYSSTIQALHSGPCVYQLYAHFAYEAAKPIDVEVDSEGTFTARVDFMSEEALAAVCKFQARLLQFDPEAEKRGKCLFEIGHEEEVWILGGAGTEGNLWSAVFNSELAGRVGVDGNAGDEFQFKAPYKAERTLGETSRTHFLSSFGGYALAVSRRSVNSWASFYAGLSIAEEAAKKWKIVPAELIDEFRATYSLLANQEADAFGEWLRFHIRPRIPYWSHVEELVSVAMEELFWELKRALDAKELTAGTGSTVEGLGSAINEWVRNDREGSDAKRIVVSLEKRIELALKNNGWNVERPERN